MSITVFCGPTLSADDARIEIDARFLPPAEQGDILRAAQQGARAIGIIDGYFQHRPSIWHKEILWAMSEGIRVYGSASMGALRAAELHDFGMIGVGEIFEAFRDGRLEDDDEVAVAHGLAESGYRAGSEAMVNIRKTLDAAVAAGVAAAPTAAALVEIAKSLFYPDRAYPLLLERAAGAGLPAADLTALRGWLRQGAINLKRLDAVAMLRRMRADLAAGPAAMKVDYRLEQTDFWYHALRTSTQARMGAHASDPAAGALRPDRVLQELRLSGVAYLEARERALLRDFALTDARRDGRRPGDDAVGRHAELLRRRHGLRDMAAFTRWLDENRLSTERFETLAREEATLAKMLDEQDVWQALLDHLRVSGRYAELQRRAEDKERRLRAAGLDEPTLADVGVTRDELARWYFARLGPMFPPDFARHAQLFGFEDEEDLIRAALREYCYKDLESRDRPARAEAR